MRPEPRASDPKVGPTFGIPPMLLSYAAQRFARTTGSARCAGPLRPIAILPMADRSGAPPNGRAEVQEWRVSIPVIAAGSVAALNLTSTMLTLLML